MSDVELLIDKPAVGGRMIARFQGRIVLVAGAIPGERVRARIEREQPGLAFASVVDVLAPDPDRRPVEGDPTCGGRDYAHIAYPRQLALKAEIVQDALIRIGKVIEPGDVPVAPSPVRGYRMRARLHVRRSRVGFFRERTHTLCDAGATGQLLPETCGLLSEIGLTLESLGRRVSTLDIAENIPGTERALHLDLSPGASVSSVELAGLERIRGVDGLTAGCRWRVPGLVRGIPFVSDSVATLVESSECADTRLRRQPASFFQGNRYLVPRMVARVLEQIPAGPAVDLYAGVGLFAVCLAAAGRASVAAVEHDPLAVDDLVTNAEPFGGGLAVHRMAVEEFLARGGPVPAAVVVDPPRPGLSRAAASALVSWSPPRIVYVSCDPATLARDVRRLGDGGYALRSIEAFDLFPETSHVETLAVLEKPLLSGPSARTC